MGQTLHIAQATAYWYNRHPSNYLQAEKGKVDAETGAGSVEGFILRQCVAGVQLHDGPGGAGEHHG